MATSEALARLAAERKLLRRHRAEYERLLRSRSHVEAVVAMVAKHKKQYGELVAEARARLEASDEAA